MSFQPRFINGKLPNQPTNQPTSAPAPTRLVLWRLPLARSIRKKSISRSTGNTEKKYPRYTDLQPWIIKLQSYMLHIFFDLRGGYHVSRLSAIDVADLRIPPDFSKPRVDCPFAGLSSSDSCDDTKWILENLHEKKHPTAKKMATVFKTVYLYDGFKTQDYDAWWIGWCLLRFRAEAPPKIRNWHQKNWTVDHLVPLWEVQKKVPG